MEDNGVSLQWVESTPTNLRFSVEVLLRPHELHHADPRREADFATSAAPWGSTPCSPPPEGTCCRTALWEWSPNSLEDD